MKRMVLVLLLVCVAVTLAACAPGPNPQAGTEEGAAGFWKGLWHGAIALITFVVSLFNDNVGIYEVNNSGGWYDFGFVLGVMLFWGGGGGGAARRR